MKLPHVSSTIYYIKICADVYQSLANQNKFTSKIRMPHLEENIKA